MKKSKLTAFALTIAMVGSSTILGNRNLYAENWYEVEANSIQERANIDYAISLAQQELANQQSIISAKEAELNQLRAQGQVLETEYKVLKKRLKKVKQAVRASYANYDDALRKLEDKQKQYGDRLLKMYEDGRPSLMTLLFSGTNIKGLFQGVELANVIADSDLQIIEKLKTAQSLAEIAKKNAELTAERSNELIAKTEQEMNKLKEGLRLNEDELNVNRQVLAERSQNLTSLQYQGSLIDANILRARQEIEYLEYIQEQELALKDTQTGPVLSEEDLSDLVSDNTVSETVEDENQVLNLEEATSEAEEQDEEVNQDEIELASEDDVVSTETEAVVEEEVVVTEETTTVEETTVAEVVNDDTSDSGDIIDLDNDNTTESTENKEEHAKLFFPNGFSRMVTSPFGWRSSPFGGGSEFHLGTDFNGAIGAPIYAANDGIVITANTSAGQGTMYGGGGSYGNYIDIQHPDGMITRYAHLQYVDVSVGQHVSRGQQIARCGSTGSSTGPHLHFEVIINGTQVDSMNYLY